MRSSLTPCLVMRRMESRSVEGEDVHDGPRSIRIWGRALLLLLGGRFDVMIGDVWLLFCCSMRVCTLCFN